MIVINVWWRGRKDEKTIKIHGKGGNERLIYLNAAAYEAIKKYLKIRPNLLKDSIDYKALFISSRNQRLSKRSVQFIIKEELSIVFGKDQKNFRTHSLRHTSATLLSCTSKIFRSYKYWSIRKIHSCIWPENEIYYGKLHYFKFYIKGDWNE